MSEDFGQACEFCGEFAANGAANNDIPAGNTCIFCNRWFCINCAGGFDDICEECDEE